VVEYASRVIDLHCHILAGLDDGARSVEDSVAMAQQAQRDGIVGVCATPHIRSDHDVRIEEIEPRVDALNQQLAERGIAVRILPGGEVAASEAERLTDAQLRALTLGGGGRWLLVEPAPGPLGAELGHVVERLAVRGFQAIIAHPERHAGVDLEQQLQVLVERGCLIQWTAEFIAQSSPGDTALALAAAGLVHLLSSDSHSALAGRPVCLTPGFARLAEICSPERRRWMAEAGPVAIVRGEPVSPPR
jgi:protein-tyrosine phosphatase